MIIKPWPWITCSHAYITTTIIRFTFNPKNTTAILFTKKTTKNNCSSENKQKSLYINAKSILSCNYGGNKGWIR